MTVTASATRTVRTVAVRKTSSVSTRMTLSKVNECTTAPVKEFVLQKAETSSTVRDPRYATTSQVKGGASRNARPMRRRSDDDGALPRNVTP